MTRLGSSAAFAAVFLAALAITVVRVRAAAPEATADAAAEIQRLEQELARAVVAIDVPAIRRIEAEGYVYTDSDAKDNACEAAVLLRGGAGSTPGHEASEPASPGFLAGRAVLGEPVEDASP